MAGIEEDIKEAVKKKKIVIGTRSVIKKMKTGRVSMVAYASNAPEGFREELERYAGISKIEVRGFRGDSAQLGGLCGRPFRALAVGIER